MPLKRPKTSLAILALCGGALLAAWPAHTQTLSFPPGISPTEPLARAGYLDATLYDGVDPSGTSDSTAGLQHALDDGYAYLMPVYLPAGTYLVSNTLQGDQLSWENPCFEGDYGDFPGETDGVQKTHNLVGASSPSRPRIVLKDDSPGFDNPDTPKAVIAFRNFDPEFAYGGSNPEWMGTAVCGFGLVVRSVDIEVGAGNPGAIGLQVPSAQFSTIEDVHIDATGGYIGLRGVVTTNAMVNIDITGGRIGAIADTCCGITFAGLTMRGQTEVGLLVASYGTITLAGFDIAPASGPAVKIESCCSQTAALTLYDGVLVPSSASPAILNPQSRSVYLNNVYVEAAAGLITSGGGEAVALSTGWQRVDEYVFTEPNLDDSGRQAFTLIDGTISQDARLSVAPADAPPADIVSRHGWSSVPRFGDAGVKNVLDSDIGATGDGVTDDTNALQAAIDAHDIVFLPRGGYRITHPLVMRGNTKLFGVSGTHARIYPRWNTGGQFDYAITTLADAGGDGYLGDIRLQMPGGYDNSYLGGIDWRVGRRSMVRQVAVELEWSAEDATQPRKLTRIRDSGGGRWYGLTSTSGNNTEHADYRHLLVADSEEPLTIYGPNFEHAYGDAAIEFTRVSNVRLLGTKSETHSFAHFSDAQNIFVAGLTASSHGPIVFDACNDVLAANLTDFPSGSAEAKPMLTEIFGGDTTIIDQDNVSLYRRGTFDSAIFSTVVQASCGDGTCGSGETCSTCVADCGVCNSDHAAKACITTTSVVIDANTDDWSDAAVAVDVGTNAKFRVKADDDALYVLVEVGDNLIAGTSATLHHNDSVELYIDGGYERGSSYDANDYQLTVDWQGNRGGVHSEIGFVSAAARTAEGFAVEFAIPRSALDGAQNSIGINVTINDNDTNADQRDGQVVWSGTSDDWDDPSTFGTLSFVDTSCADLVVDSGSDADPTQTTRATSDGCQSVAAGFAPWLVLAGLLRRVRLRPKCTSVFADPMFTDDMCTPSSASPVVFSSGEFAGARHRVPRHSEPG